MTKSQPPDQIKCWFREKETRASSTSLPQNEFEATRACACRVQESSLLDCKCSHHDVSVPEEIPNSLHRFIEDRFKGPVYSLFQIMMDDVYCGRNEKSVMNCRHRGWHKSNCDHYEDAGVICHAPKLQGHEVCCKIH